MLQISFQLQGLKTILDSCIWENVPEGYNILRYISDGEV